MNERLKAHEIFRRGCGNIDAGSEVVVFSKETNRKNAENSCTV